MRAIERIDRAPAMGRKSAGLVATVLLLAFAMVVSEAMAVPTKDEIEAAKKTQARHEDDLLSREGVVGVGVGLTEQGDQVAILVYVDRSAGDPSLPPNLEGIPVVRIDLPGPIQPQDQGNPATSHQLHYFTPVPMGVETSNENLNGAGGFTFGTLGFRVRRKGSPDDVGYITNNHVAAAFQGTLVGDLCPAQLNPANLIPFGARQCQPERPCGANDPNTFIGNLIQVIPLVMGGEFLNTVDAALVESNRALVSNSILDLGRVDRNRVVFPELGDTVCKSGATTGLTAGIVEALNVTVKIGYGPRGVCGTAKFVNQISIGSKPGCNPGHIYSLGGDSGSPTVKCKPSCKADKEDESTGQINGGTAKAGEAVGLHFAGIVIGGGMGSKGFANPLPVVLDALGVELDPTIRNEPNPGGPR